MKNKLNSFLYILLVFLISLFSFVGLFSSSILNVNNANINSKLVVNNSLKQSNEDIITPYSSSEYFKIRNLGNTLETDPIYENVKSIYRRRPSELLAKETTYDEPPAQVSFNSLLNLFEFNEEKVIGYTNDASSFTNAPKIINLSNVNQALNYNKSESITYSSDTPMEYLMPLQSENSESTVYVTQNDLDDWGILILLVILTDRNTPSIKYYQYVSIPGFNTYIDRNFSSNNIVLDKNEYEKSVNTITNNDLILFPQFEGSNKVERTTKLISRENNQREGIIKYELSFSYFVRPEISINEEKKTAFIVLNKYSKENYSNINWDFNKEFLLKGFQKSLALPYWGVIVINIVLLIIGAAICSIVILIAFIVKNTKYKKSDY